MQQAPDQGALAVVDVAAGEEAQQFLALVLGQVGEDVLADQIGLVAHGAESLEVALTFLLFHRTGLVMVDDTALAFGGTGQEHFWMISGSDWAVDSTAPVSG